MNISRTRTYQKILEHRKTCPFWMNKTKGMCMDCFGGGLNQFISSITKENNAYMLTMNITTEERKILQKASLILSRESIIFLEGYTI